MLEFLALLLAVLRAALRDRAGLVAEDLVLRHQLAILNRPTRRRPRVSTRDELPRVLSRWLWRDRRRHHKSPRSRRSTFTRFPGP